jgi:lipopolysaccharide assembly outer membrane protein LptD (OstA)
LKSVLCSNTCPVPHRAARAGTVVMKNCPICLVLFILLLAANVLCQDQFDVSADKLFGSAAGAEEIIILEGNVRIVHGTTTALADTGFYERNREMVRLIGSVRVKDGDIEVTGQECEYLRMARKVIFARGIEARDTSAVLMADRGVYDLETEILDVEGHITYSETHRLIRAEQAVYFRQTGFVRATGNVYMEDRQQGSILRAGEVTYDRDTGFGIASQSPWLEISASEGRDALMVEADSMELYADDRRAVAVGSVRIVRGEAEGTAGRAIFMDDEDKTILTDGPTVVEGESSLSGETITIFSGDGQISKVLVSGAARSVYHPPGEERSELTGEVIELAFDGGEVSEMLIRGAARGVFFPTGTDTAGESLMNEVDGETITLLFDAGEARSANVTGGVNGIYRLESEVAGGDVVTYESDSLYYDVPSAVMHLKGAAGIEYKGMRLKSESIEYNARTHNLYASVEPVLWEGNDKITGASMTYNLKSKRGTVETGRTAYEGGLYTGELIRKTGERALNVGGGTYTTCNNLDAHYSFTSSTMKVIVDDKVIAKPVILKLRDLPVFALPYFMFPIKRGRHSGILIPRVELGFDQDRGRFLRNVGYYWAPSDYFDMTLWGDYYENYRWIGHLETRYRKRYSLSGQFEGSYTSEIETGDTRWDLGGRHTQQIGEEGKLILHADFVSDEEYRQDVSDDLEKQLRRQLESDISYSTKWNDRSVTIAAERRENLDTDKVTQTLPRLSFLLNRTTLIAPSKDEEAWHRGTFLSGRLSASSKLDKTGDEENAQQEAKMDVNLTSDFRLQGKSQNLRSNTVLTAVRKDPDRWCKGCVGDKWTNSAIGNKTDFITKFVPFGWLNFDPSLSLSLTLYDNDKAGNRFQLRTMYWGGFSSTASIYRTFFPRLGPIQAVRHVMTPRVSFTYRPDFSKYGGRFFPLPGISGEVGKSSVMNISLENRLQAKVAIGEDVIKINNLLSLVTTTTYDFLYRDRGAETPWSTIRNHLRIYPARYLDLDLSFANDPRDLSFESLDFQTGFQYTGGRPLFPGFIEPVVAEEPTVPEEGVNKTVVTEPTAGPWHLGLIYRYTKAFDGGDDSYWLDFQTGFNFTSNWRIEYGGRFNLSGKETVYQEFTLYRDLHCWEARFVRRFSQGSWQYFFRINIKVLPEIYAERGLRALYRQY